MELERPRRGEVGHEQAARLRLAEEVTRVRATGQGTGETRADPVDHGDVGQDLDQLLLLGRQDLVDDVVLDQSVVAVAERHHVVARPWPTGRRGRPAGGSPPSRRRARPRRRPGRPASDGPSWVSRSWASSRVNRSSGNRISVSRPRARRRSRGSVRIPARCHDRVQPRRQVLEEERQRRPPRPDRRPPGGRRRRRGRRPGSTARRGRPAADRPPSTTVLGPRSIVRASLTAAGRQHFERRDDALPEVHRRHGRCHPARAMPWDSPPRPSSRRAASSCRSPPGLPPASTGAVTRLVHQPEQA